MKLYPHNLLADAKEERRQGERAFTMIEIAIAIGVIGFALVAVIGILPAGMNVQKDNREDTTISQDAPFFIDAIRSGSTNVIIYDNNTFEPVRGLDFLTNYVESIVIISNYGVNAPMKTTTNAAFSNLGSGWQILGLLSTPEMPFVSSNNFTITRAIVRSLSGAAVQQNGANRATSFRYQMDIQIVPFVNVAPDSTNYQFYLDSPYNYPTNSPEVLTRYYRYLEVNPFPSFTLTPQTVVNLPYAVGSLAFSCFDVKMRFSWPVIDTGNGNYVVGPNRQTYRTTISSAIAPATTPSGAVLFLNGQRYWFFQPQSYITKGYQ